MADIGLIGIGLVGTAIAERLLAAGCTIAGFDIDAQQLELFAGQPMESARAVAEAASIIILSLPDSDAVESVVNQIESACCDKLVIDTTTGDPERTARLGQRLHDAGIDYVDATIAGSSQQVRNREVITMLGGETEATRRCEEIVSHFAKQSFHVGPWGGGARMKLVVNLVLGLNRAVLAEGLSFAKAVGVDANDALEVLKSSPAYSRVMDTKGGKMITRDFIPIARLSQHLKDVRLILAAAQSNKIDLPLSRLHSQLLELLEESGYGDEDNSAIIRAYQQRAPT